jgi:hypothetical protein
MEMKKLFNPKQLVITASVFASTVAFAQKNVQTTTPGVPMVKGTWFAGGTLSTGSREADNESQLFAFVVNQRKRDFEVSLDGGYLFKDKLAAGLGLLYGRTKEELTTKSSDGILTDKRVAGDYFAFRPFIKNFLPLGKSNQFFVVIPTELQIGFGNKVTESVTDLVLTRTYTSSNYYGIAMRPGILAFIHRNFGCQVSVGAFGLSSSVEKSTTTNQPDSRVKTQDLDLKINILSLSLGFTGYF